MSVVTASPAAQPFPAAINRAAASDGPSDPRPANGRGAALPRLVGHGHQVPLVTGGTVEYADLDHAASTRALVPVHEAVTAALPWYASVHRGAGFASQTSTRLLEAARTTIAAAVGARPDDATVLTRNTTDATNLLARCLPPRTAVVVFASEHHATLLPWRGRVERLPVPRTPAEAVAAAEAALAALPRGPRLLAVTAASNVTGEIWPVADLVEVAHRHGARVLVDAAQYVPHRPVDLAAWDADYLVFSGHKLYAPYGCGVLVGRADWLAAADPYLRGGGASAQVGAADTVWAGLPDRQEAGTPNVLGAVAVATALDVLNATRAEAAAHEAALLTRLRTGLDGVPGLRQLSIFGPDHDRVGIASFTVRGLPGGLVAAALSAEYGIGVRDGRFCAHPLVEHLVAAAEADAASEALPGKASTAPEVCTAPAVRASVGLGSTADHIDRLLHALRELATTGPRWTYAEVAGRHTPTPDPRALPVLPAVPWFDPTA